MTGGYWWLVILAAWLLCLAIGLALDNYIANRKRNRYVSRTPTVYRPRAYVDQRGETPDPRQDLPSLLRRQAE